jgi:hypothetical protein
VNSLFNGKALRLLQVRVGMTESDITDLEVQINFDIGSFRFADPANLTVYYRGQPGQGLFVPLDTQYNFVTKQLQATVASLSARPHGRTRVSVAGFLRRTSLPGKPSPDQW